MSSSFPAVGASDPMPSRQRSPEPEKPQVASHSGARPSPAMDFRVNGSFSLTGAGARSNSISPSKSGWNHHGSESSPMNKEWGRAFGIRLVRMIRRGQLPFLLVFFACVIIFFTALTGVGYVDPEAKSLEDFAISGHEEAFMPGQPVHAGFAEGERSPEDERRAEMRRLEEEWSRAKRPRDGAWMKKQRDQGVVRRKPLPKSPSERKASDPEHVKRDMNALE